MLIEIHGAGFKNKGAQLMLQTVVEKLSEKIPDSDFCIAAGKYRPHSEAGRLGLKFVWPSKILEGRRGKFKAIFKASNFGARLIHRSSLNPYGLVKRSQVDALVDISGFAFGDSWGPTLMNNFSTLARYYKERDCPVVMLPQMLGPFEKLKNQEAFRTLTQYCDAIYARDKTSFDVSRKVSINPDKIRLSPDITLFQKNLGVESSPDQKQEVIIVPNMRMLDMDTPWEETQYVSTLSAIGRQAIEHGHVVTVVIHEAQGKDFYLAQQICHQLSLPESRIFTNPDPKLLKAKIAEGIFLAGSRFHSLAAALSTHTPVIAIGWAHKYGQLLNDFGVESFDIKSPADAKRIPLLVDALLDNSERSNLVNTLKEHHEDLAIKNKKMWDEVVTLITKPI
jgi:colanic acid/amylovoran biosynthesis protein